NQVRMDYAISKTSNPTSFTPADWNLFRVNTNDGVGATFDFSDYPKVGYNADGYVVSFNMFPNLGFFDHVSVVAIRNDGTTPGIKTVPGGFNNFPFAPAAMQDASPGGPMWFVNTPNVGGSASTVGVVRMDNVFSTSPPFTTPSLPINSYAAPPRAQQQGGGQTLDTLDARYYFSVEQTVGGVEHLV